MATLDSVSDYRARLTTAARTGDNESVSSILSEIPEGFDLNYTTPTPPLIAACETGQLEVVKLLVQREDVEVNIVSGDRSSITPLSAAATKGYVEVMKVLIQNSASIDYVGEGVRDHQWNKSALYQALFYNQYEAAELLLKNGVSLHHSYYFLMTVLPGRGTFDPPDSARAYPPGHGSSTEKMRLFKLLLDHGADINSTDPQSGKSLLIKVCDCGSWECARLLIECGVDVTDKERHKGLLAVVTRRQNKLKGVKEFVTMLLEQGVDVDEADDDDGETSLTLACRRGDIDTAQLLLKYRADVNVMTKHRQTALSFACHRRDTDLAKLLIKNGANVNHVTENGPILSRIILHVPDFRHTHLTENTDYNTIKLLLDNKADVNLLINVNGRPSTPLMCAVQICNERIIKELLKYGGIPDALVLAKAFECTILRLPILELLLKHASEDAIRDGMVSSFLVQAVQEGRCGSADSSNYKVVKLLLQFKANVNAMYNGTTALIEAVSHGLQDFTKLLLDHGAQVNLKNSNGDSALIVASEKGKTKCVELLLGNKYRDLNLRNRSEESALIVATRCGHSEITRLLLDHGAQPNLQNINRDTPLIVASQRSDTQIVKQLLPRVDSEAVNHQNNKLHTALMLEACKQTTPSDEKQTSVVSDFQRVATPLTVSGIDTSAPAIWELNKIHDKLNGEGIVIAIIDNGVNHGHKGFTRASAEGRLRGRRYLEKEGETTGELGAPISGEKASHGTMAAFVAVGEPFGDVKSGGVAPKSTFWICSVGKHFNEFSIINALKDLIKIKKENKIYAPDVVSISFGLKYIADDVNQIKMASHLRTLRDLGVVIVAAAGNFGNCEGGILFPAVEPEVICVGAHGEVGDKMNINPPGNIDCFAPGRAVLHPGATDSKTYERSSGTSCAAPAIAGLIALLLQFSGKYVEDEAKKKKYRDPTFLKQFLKEHRKGGDPIMLDPVSYFERKIIEYEKKQSDKKNKQLQEDNEKLAEKDGCLCEATSPGTSQHKIAAVLTEKDHLKIVQFVRSLENSDILLLGQALGLWRSKLKRLDPLPDEMVDAWLRQEDDVADTSGPPTWRSLCVALRAIDQNELAGKIENFNHVSVSYGHPDSKDELEHRDVTRDLNEETPKTQEHHPSPSNEEPLYGKEEMKEIIKSYKPVAKVKVDAEPLKKDVQLILLTCNENEKWAVYEKLKPPTLDKDVILEMALLLPENNSVIGRFGGYTVAVLTTEQGKKSERELKSALDFFPNVTAIIAVGVGYGKDRDSLKFGDVMVSDHIEDASQASFVEDHASEQIRVEQRGPCTAIKKELLRYFRKTAEWEAKNDFKVSKEGRSAIAKVGTIVSSEALMRSETLKNQYMGLTARTIGGEMEGCVLLNMIEWMQARPLSVIVIKGVADYGDNDKDKRWQFTAAKAAADFVHYCLEETGGGAKFVPCDA